MNEFLAFSISLGNDVLGGGKAAEAISWSNLAEKLLKAATTPSAVGGMAMILISAALAGLMAWKHTDANDKYDVFEPKNIAMAIVDVGVFFVGLKLLFF